MNASELLKEFTEYDQYPLCEVVADLRSGAETPQSLAKTVVEDINTSFLDGVLEEMPSKEILKEVEELAVKFFEDQMQNYG